MQCSFSNPIVLWQKLTCATPIPLSPFTPVILPLQVSNGSFEGDDDFPHFYDTRLPFGAKSSPEIFHHLTQAVRQMMARRGFNSVVVYLDDFLVIAPTQQACQVAYSTLLQLLQDLGFAISWRKVVGPTQKLVFLGIELDTKQCTMALPPTKLAELHMWSAGFCFSEEQTNSNLLAN